MSKKCDGRGLYDPPKVMYKNAGHANRFKKSESERTGINMRIYQCPICGYWHLSSFKPERQELRRQMKRIRGRRRKPKKR